jgi:4-aminobutyrate aminotransferase-like enzyme
VTELTEQDVRERDARFVITSGAPSPVTWKRASGSTVWGFDGREYIDLTSGVVVTSLGHAHPRVAAAVAEAAATLSNCYDAVHPARGALAEKLTQLAGPPFDSVCFQSTGSEGIEAALRMARSFTHRHEALSFEFGYHGKTLGALSVTAVPPLKAGVGPLLPGTMVAPYAYCYRCPLGLSYPACSIACADQMWDVERNAGSGKLAAVIVEPLLGVGGAVVPPPEFWAKVRRFADEKEALLVFDEVQSAFGRSGDTWFAFQKLGIAPDIVVAGKSIANGVPITAVLARREIFDATPFGALRSTYGGNPVSCAAALATIAVMEEENLPERSGRLGRRILDLLRSWVGEVPGVGDARGLGMNLGVEVVSDVSSRRADPDTARRVYLRGLELGVMVLPPTGPYGNTLRIAPPLTIPEEQLWDGFRRLRQAFEDSDAAIPRT